MRIGFQELRTSSAIDQRWLSRGLRLLSVVGVLVLLGSVGGRRARATTATRNFPTTPMPQIERTTACPRIGTVLPTRRKFTYRNLSAISKTPVAFPSLSNSKGPTAAARIRTFAGEFNVSFVAA